MPKGIDQFVSENRRATRRIDSTFIEVSSQNRVQYNFGNNKLQLPASIEIYTRPINDGLYSGHPNPEHGSGRGRGGDRRGSWTLQENEELSEEFVKQGRNAIRDTLAGEGQGGIREVVVGSGTTEAQTANTRLEQEHGRTFAWGHQGPSSNTTNARSHFHFAECGDGISECGVVSGNSRLYNRITTNPVTVNEEQEVRVDVLFEVLGSGTGNSVVTDDGLNAIAESIRTTEANVGIEEFTFGSSDATPSKSDSALGNELFTKRAERNREPEVVTAHSVVFEAEPSGQPYTVKEMGLKDNTGRLLWRTVVDPFDKDDSTEFEVYSSFRAK